MHLHIQIHVSRVAILCPTITITILSCHYNLMILDL